MKVKSSDLILQGSIMDTLVETANPLMEISRTTSLHSLTECMVSRINMLCYSKNFFNYDYDDTTQPSQEHIAK